MTNIAALLFERLEDFQSQHDLLGRIDATALVAGLSAEEHAALAEGVSRGRWALNRKLLHSDRDPQREAARASITLSGAKYIVCVSTGAGFLLGHLPVTIKEVLVLEPNPFCLAAFLLAGEYKKSPARITLFAHRLSEADALEDVLPWLQGKNLKQTVIYLHAAARAADPPLYTRAYERVVQLFEKRSVNQATIIKFQRLWNKNIFLNQRVMATASTLNDLLSLQPPDAIVLAGAGPSLAASFAELRENRSRFVLMAADTAVVPLAKAGIYPDYAFAADPQWVNHHFTETSASTRPQWIMDPVVCPAIPRALAMQGAKLSFWNNVFLSDTVLRVSDRGDVAHGGSVSTNAFDIASRWLLRRAESVGPGRLILVGQDLSFPNRQAHCKGAVLEAQVFARSHRLSGMEQHNLRQMRALPVLWVKGITELKVRTNAKLKIFLEWFSARASARDSHLRLINATHDGAHIAGFEHVNLSAALDGLSERAHLPLSGVAAESSKTKDVRTLVKAMGEIIELMQENAQLTSTSPLSAAAIQRLDANDARFKSQVVAKNIVALGQQALILKITEHGDEISAHEFYRSMAQAAREARHWAQKLIAPENALH